MYIIVEVGWLCVHQVVVEIRSLLWSARGHMQHTQAILDSLNYTIFMADTTRDMFDGLKAIT